jgi:hypothetical protein
MCLDYYWNNYRAHHTSDFEPKYDSFLLVMPHTGNYGPKIHTLVEKYNAVGFKIEMTNYYIGPQANIVLMLFI